MQSKIQYRDGDFDLDSRVVTTASYPVGLDENYRFLPGLEPKMRRTSSAEEIACFYRYYELTKMNSGGLFTWRQYLQILKNDLRFFNLDLVEQKLRACRITPTPSLESGMSHYVTATESETSWKRSPGKLARWRKRRDVLVGDNASISSIDSNISLTPQSSLLKRMCSEIRTIAQKTSKNFDRTVEKLSSKSKYCSSCGDYIGSQKLHRKCSQSLGDGSGCGPLRSDAMKITRTVKRVTRSVTFVSPAKDRRAYGEGAEETAAKKLKPYYKRQ